MNFNHLPSQLTILLLGWVFTLYLQRLANIRTEVTRRKDKLIDKIDKLADWAEKKLSEPNYDPAITEEIYTALISQIEIRLNQVNSLLKNPTIPSSYIADLRNVDVYNTKQSAANIQKIRNYSLDLSESLELACNTRYFDKPNLRQKANIYVSELLGILVGASSLLVLALLFRVLQKLLS